MREYRNSQADGSSADTPVPPCHFVPLARAADGIGRALRRAFGPCSKAQDEFASLLRRIDQLTGIGRG